MKSNKNQLELYFNQTVTNKKISSKFDTRINILISFFSILILTSLIKLLFLGLEKKDFFTNESYVKKNYTRRDIVDRNGIVIAHDLKTFDLILRKNKVKNYKNLSLKLKIIFPDINLDQVNKDDKSFFILKKNLTLTEYKKVLKIAEPSLELIESETRVYPHKNLFSHIIGNVDTELQGVSGLESYLNTELLQQNQYSEPVKTSLDTRVQFIIRDILNSSIQTFSAKGASAILIDANDGKVISMVSLPDFDPNLRKKYETDSYFNKNTKGLYEPGSVFKTFAIANAIEKKSVTKSTLFENLPSKVFCGKFPIEEYRYAKDKKNLSVQNIIVKSSNIGTIRVIQKTGLETQQKFLEDLEIFEKSTIELPEVSFQKPKSWGVCRTLTSGFGHGVSTTPLQLTRAYAAIVNGGFLINNSILLEKISTRKKIISDETSNVMNEILRSNVDKKYQIHGSGRNADITDYYVAGKTGTANKASSNFKGYSDEVINFFVASFPSKKPKYVLTVLLDEPHGAYSLWKHNRRESGWNSVYIAGKIIEKTGPILDTLSTDLVVTASLKNETQQNFK